VPQDLARAEQAARHSDLLLAVGSSLSVYPVAGLVPLARDFGAQIIIINAMPTDMDPVADAVLLGNIGEVLPALF
jgi:NAD-dependent deacetylase